MTAENINWKCVKYEALSLDEMYDILALRAAIFVVEQNCPYQDLDGKDRKAFHLSGYVGDRLCAYVRILPPGISYEEVSIGRVVVDEQYRKKGLGISLMQEGLKRVRDQFGPVPVRISAQLYLKKFYRSLGFEPVGSSYLEDGIPHIEMLYSGK